MKHIIPFHTFLNEAVKMKDPKKVKVGDIAIDGKGKKGEVIAIGKIGTDWADMKQYATDSDVAELIKNTPAGAKSLGDNITIVALKYRGGKTDVWTYDSDNAYVMNEAKKSFQDIAKELVEIAAYYTDVDLSSDMTNAMKCDDRLEVIAFYRELKDMMKDEEPAKYKEFEKEATSFLMKYSIQESVNNVVNEAGKWETENLKADFYNFWASLDIAASNISNFMNDMNKGKTQDAVYSLKVAYEELTEILKKKDIEKNIKNMELELRDKNAIR
jgi:hypothetical protein